MRDLQKNQEQIYYALRNVSKTKDEWGNTTDVTGYSEPQSLYISISANKGEASAEAFGADIRYERQMSTHDMSCPIDEFSHLWLDGRDPADTHNFEVAAVSKSLNCIRYAIKKVNVSR